MDAPRIAGDGSLCWQTGNHVEKGEIVPLDSLLFPMFRSHGLRMRNRVAWHFEHGTTMTRQRERTAGGEAHRRRRVRGGDIRTQHERRAGRGGHPHPLDPARIAAPGFPPGDVRIVRNAHCRVSIPADAISAARPADRFREPLLTGIRAWIGHHAGRPGHISIG